MSKSDQSELDCSQSSPFSLKLYIEKWFYGLQASIPVWIVYCAMLSNACTYPTSNSPIIVKYRAAECIPFSVHPRIQPRTREWDYNITLSDGVKVEIEGAQSPGGRVAAFYGIKREYAAAADPGDYIYPSDIRLNRRDELLYVKAYGSAGGFATQTWLFEYDLRQRAIIKRLRVTNGVLQAECTDIAGSAVR
jgi:hypothetical protein